MSIFKIKVVQYAEEICEIEVEAETLDKAKNKVDELIEKGDLDLEYDLDWQDGNSIHDDGIVIEDS